MVDTTARPRSHASESITWSFNEAQRCSPMLISIEGNICGETRRVLDVLRKDGFAVFTLDESLWDPMPRNECVTHTYDDSFPARVCVEYAHISRAIDALDMRALKTLSNGIPVVFIERWVGSVEHVFLRAATHGKHCRVSQNGVRLWNDLTRLLDLASNRVHAYMFLDSPPTRARDALVARAPRLADVADAYVQEVCFYYNDYMKRLQMDKQRVARIRTHPDEDILERVLNDLVRLFI